MKSRSRGKGAVLVLTGMLVGTLIPSAANAAGEYLQAVHSSQEFFVDGQRVELEAYAIEGTTM